MEGPTNANIYCAHYHTYFFRFTNVLRFQSSDTLSMDYKLAFKLF